MAHADALPCYRALISENAGARLFVSADGARWRRTDTIVPAQGGTALACAPDDTLWCAYRTSDGTLHVSALTPRGERSRHRVSGPTTSSRPALAWWHGRLAVGATSENGAAFVAVGSPDRLELRQAHPTARAEGGVALAATPARLYLAFTGTDEGLYFASSDDGNSFPLAWLEPPEKPSGAPSLSAWGPDITVAVRSENQRVLLALSRGRSKLEAALVGGGAITAQPPAVVLDPDGVTALLAGTDGALWYARGAPEALEFAPVESVSAPGPVSLARSREGEPAGPARTVVRPVLFFPDDVPVDEGFVAKASEQIATHLAVAQERYRRWLVTDTFPFVDARVVRSRRVHLDYKKGDAFWDIFREICDELGDCDATSTSAYLTFFVRPSGFEDQLWFGAGGPSTEGSGMALLDARCILEDQPYPMQSTLVHELGHAFGLPHVDAWGEDLYDCDSVMSYSSRHHTFGPSTPSPDGRFLPEELDLLGRNEVAFPRFEYDPAIHNPTGRPLRTRIA